MSESFTVQSYRRSYAVLFVDSFEDTLVEVLTEGDFLIVDANVADHFKEQFTPVLAKHPHRLVEPSEEAKSYQKLEGVIQELLDLGFRKNHRLIAIGGGIVQDITAFTASILYRGVDWIFFPSNLLSQCDSCIGSKTSINFGNLKNQLGGFYPPAAIFIASDFLSTLPDRDMLSGLGEMAHYFLVSGEEDFEWFAEKSETALRNWDLLQEMIHRSLAIKKAMIERDEFDEGPRNVFNYGHTFGHALESVTDYAVPHGIAVAYGMDLANVVSVDQGLIQPEFRNRVRTVLARIWENFPLSEIDIDSYLAALAHDKKNTGSKFCPILTGGAGKMFKAELVMDASLREKISEYFTSDLQDRTL